LGISIAVCTFNRSRHLKRCLESLAAQTLEPSEFEIIIVDNNSMDATRDVAAKFTSAHDNFSYILEPKQGLSHARNAGFEAALHDYVGYFDDDSVAPPNWLKHACGVVNEHRPHVFGGPHGHFFDETKPHWFKDNYETYSLGGRTLHLTEEDWLPGTNIFFRRALLTELGGFDPNHGMVGTSIGYGEETALLRRAWKLNQELKVVYEPKMRVYHLVPEYKTCWGWNVRSHFLRGRSTYKVVTGNIVHHPALLPFFAARLLLATMFFPLHMAIGLLFRDPRAYPFPQNYLYEKGLADLRRIGRYYQQVVTGLVSP
jgi:GT2 family glycosyltransferase